jgi:prepilin-type processing-associated H-X9-DG protein
MFTFGIPYGMQDCIDGSSQTIAFAEWVVGSQGRFYENTVPPRRYRGNMVMAAPGSGGVFLNVNQNPQIVLDNIEGCRRFFQSSASDGNIADFKGWRWSHGNPGFSLFNVVQTPNDIMGGCRIGGNPDYWPDSSYVVGAGSAHPGGCNTAMSDGSVKFVKDSVNRATWWSLGTRNGGEIISADAY